MESVKDFLLHIIPTTLVDAFAKGEILQVLFIAILFGVALQKVGGRVSNVFALVEKTSEILFAIVRQEAVVTPSVASSTISQHQ